MTPARYERLPKKVVEYGKKKLLLTQRQIDLLIWVAEGREMRKFPDTAVGGGPVTRLSNYLRRETGFAGKATVLYCRVAFGAGLVKL